MSVSVTETVNVRFGVTVGTSFSDGNSRGQKRPAILRNPGMDTFRPTEPLSSRKDTLILLWPSKLVKMSFFGEII